MIIVNTATSYFYTNLHVIYFWKGLRERRSSHWHLHLHTRLAQRYRWRCADLHSDAIMLSWIHSGLQHILKGKILGRCKCMGLNKYTTLEDMLILKKKKSLNVRSQSNGKIARCSKVNFYQRGGGGILPWFWARTCGWSPRTPPHSYTRRNLKNGPIHILPLSKIVPIHLLFFKCYPYICFLGEKDTPLIYVWCEDDSHSYTRRPEKYTPSSRTSVYSFTMEVTPPVPAEIRQRTNLSNPNQ